MAKIILFVLTACFLLPRGLFAEGIQFDGEVTERLGKKVQCATLKPLESQRKVSAAVYSRNRLVCLPGTQEAIVNEWLKVGEMTFQPVLPGETPQALVEWEAEPNAIQRSCHFILLPNRAPVLSSIQMPKTSLSPGTKMFVSVSGSDPENDGFFINWKASKGRWLRARTRSSFNYYIAPLEEGEVNLNFTATDVYGAFSEKTAVQYVTRSEARDLYQLKQSVLLFESGDNLFLDALTDSKGMTLVLEKNALTVFSPQGLMQNCLKEGFSSAVKLQTDTEGYLYILDLQKKNIIKLNRDGKPLLTFTDLSESGDLLKIENPVDFEVSPDGRVFLLDQTLSRVLVFNSDGNLGLTVGVKGSGKGQLMQPVALAWSEDLLYVLDAAALKVKVFGRSFEEIKTFDLSERFQYTDLEVDSFNRALYVAGNLPGDSGKLQAYVIRFDLGSGTSTSAVLEGLGGRGVRSLSLDLEGNLITTGIKAGPVVIQEASGAWKASFLMEHINKSSLLTSGPLGSLYFQSGKNVKRLDPWGCVDKVYENNGTLLALSADSEENLYLLNKDTTKVIVFDSAGRRTKDVALPLEASEKLLGMGVDSSRRIYLLKKPATMLLLSSTGELLKQQDLLALNFENSSLATPKMFPPSELYVAKDGRILLVDKNRKQVLSCSADFSKNILFSGNFKKVTDVCCDGYGNVYILDSGKGSVFKYDSGGGLKREIEVSKQLKYPSGITVFGDGDLVVQDDSDKALYFFK